MDDYEQEYFMVQGFAAAAGSGPGGPGSMLPGSASSEFVSDGQQGNNIFLKYEQMFWGCSFLPFYVRRINHMPHNRGGKLITLQKHYTN
jgi:hypothetical protein